MIADDAFTTPGDGEEWPQIGRGGHLRNANGEALVLPPNRSRHRRAIGGSSLDVFYTYTGPSGYADVGSHVHTITEWADAGLPVDDLIRRGETVGVDGDTTRHCYDSYLEFIAELGWSTVLTECIVVNDNYSVPIASNIDKIMSTGGGHVVVDVKSANSFDHRGYAMQLAAYVDSVIYNPTTGERTPLPRPLATDVAYIMSYTIRVDRIWKLVEVDVPVGRDLLQEFDDLRKDQRHKSAFRMVDIAAPPPPSGVEQRGGGDATHGSETSPPPTLDELRATVKAWTDADRAALVAYFDRHDVDTADAGQVSEAMAAVRSFHDVTVDPPPSPVAEPVAPTPTLDTPDEGDDADDRAVDALEARYHALDDAGRAWVNAIGRQAQQAGLSFHMNVATGGRRSIRRLRLMGALVALADGFDNDDAVRGSAAVVNAEVADAMSFNLGQVVGHMGADEAGLFADVVAALVDGNASMRFTDDRRCRVEVAA